MIIDQGIFSLARSGTIDETLDYPVMLDTTSGRFFRRGQDAFDIAGRNVKVPELLQAEGKDGWFMDEDEDIAIIPDAITLLQRPAKLINRILSLRKQKGFRALIYAPGIGDPYLMPVLNYAGISIFDDFFVRSESSEKVQYTIFGRKTVAQNPLESNILFANDILKIVSESIRNGTLRELIEKYSISSRAVEILRILDNSYYEYIERVFPLRTGYIKANTVESLLRPDLLRYRNYVAESYVKPASKKVALIVPCTARKPYSVSKTHRRIFGYIENYVSILHKVVVTSPVGIVPEELEETYPPQFYDIPTIGTWFEDEKKMIRDMLANYLRRNSYQNIIAYITPDLSFIEDILPSSSVILEGNVKSEDMLHQLKNEVSSIYRDAGKPGRTNHKFEKMKSVAHYQFGPWILPHLEEMKLVRSYNQDMLTKNGKAMLVYNQKAGKLTITKEMGNIFIKEQKFVVEIDDFKPTASVYAMGVKSASNDIRQEGEVVISCNGDIRGVGIAKMPASLMKDLQKGIAVKVRN